MSSRPGGGRGDDGTVSVVVAVLLASGLLFGVGALAIDLGNAFARESSLQKVADLAALAAAQELPDLDAARRAAIATLCADANRPAGWPWPSRTSCESDTGWATSADPTTPDADGEIEFYTGSPAASGRYDATQRIGSASGLAATAVRVVTPPAVVQFGLANGVPGLPSSVPVRKSATAMVLTPTRGGVLPFYLLSDEAMTAPPAPAPAPPVAPPICIAEVTDPALLAGCPGSSAALRAGRGIVDEPIDTVGGLAASFPANVESGLNHPVHDYRFWPCGVGGTQQAALGSCPTQGLPAVNAPCGGSLLGVSQATFGSATSWTPEIEVNCLTVSQAPWAQYLQQSLFTDPSARLLSTCPGDVGPIPHVAGGGGFDTNVLLDPANTVALPPSLLAPEGLSATQLAEAGDALARGLPNPLPGPLFSSAIFACARLAVVPVLSVSVVGPPPALVVDGTYPVVGFSYAWLGSSDPDNGLIWDPVAGQYAGVRLQPIDPSYFPPTPPSTPLSPDDLKPLTISDDLLTTPAPAAPGVRGPKTVRLIHDADDPAG